jgi:hypothetical protein
MSEFFFMNAATKTTAVSLTAIHPFIVRNWRKATKGSIRVSRKCAQWFFQRCQKVCDFRHW